MKPIERTRGSFGIPENGTEKCGFHGVYGERDF